MSNYIHDYITTINKRYKLGQSSEHTFRGDLEQLLRNLVPNVDITNEPSKVTDCGNPDYVISKGKIPIGFIEAKDIGKDLNSKQYKEQFDRYRNALDNLIITDYLHFKFYQNGNLVHEISIGDINGGQLVPLEENFFQFSNLIKEFCTFISQTIKSAKRLAELMAGKARLLENTLENAVTADDDNESNTELRQQYETFKSILIHDLTPKAFADIYAQTLAYGMFAARLHDPSLNDFSRQEASELIPKTNPFLRRLFDYVAGANIDERIRTTVDNLADVFRATNVAELLKDFGKATQTQDPIIHFYETFLAEYNPKLRKQRGVWYTPEPVVNFIVRAVDSILKTEFGLSDGLADTSKTSIEVNSQTPDKRSKTGYKRIQKQVHKVQVLDPATGTGTFLAEVISHIYKSKFDSMQGMWSSYVENELIPRLNGFEILMASYAMAHLKLDLLLTETGYKPTKEQRFNIYLTNSLEEHHPDTGTLFANWLSAEANSANYIKRDTPVMVVIGNPPYSISSSNKSDWIETLMMDYKRGLNERNIQPLSDDYIKFLRYGQYFVEKNGEGVLAFISNNNYIDGVIHKQMRKELATVFDDIYILDLHGNAKRKEVAEDGSKDENVFDILAGVSISILIKKKEKSNNLARVRHIDIFGSRKHKYSLLANAAISSIEWSEVDIRPPNFSFVPINYDLIEGYNKGFDIREFFKVNSGGVKTHRDNLVIDFSFDNLQQRIQKFYEPSLTDQDISAQLDLKSTGSWDLSSSRKTDGYDKSFTKTIAYRPFDRRYIYYNPSLIDRDRSNVMKNLFKGDNFALIIGRQGQAVGSMQWNLCSIAKDIVDFNYFYRGGGTTFPLYLTHDGLDGVHEVANVNPDIVKKLEHCLGLTYVESEAERDNGDFAPIDILDYIYAVLHSPSYRDTYKEFLKSDFPKIPYPTKKDQFLRLSKSGRRLRKLHLLESDFSNAKYASYPAEGDNKVTRNITKASPGFELVNSDSGLGKVWINEEQYFDNVPQVAWEFYIGGYQPAQKWLKDRKGMELSYEDILHYQKIITVLVETEKIMKEIDEVDFL